MQSNISFAGRHLHLLTPDELSTGINAAIAVFAQHNVDPSACAEAVKKLEQDELLSRDEALLCVIWDTADDKAFRAMTLGWLIRDVDICLAIDPVT